MWNMRPNEDIERIKIYECFSCGNRLADPETSFCPECGGELNRLSKPRDL